MRKTFFGGKLKPGGWPARALPRPGWGRTAAIAVVALLTLARGGAQAATSTTKELLGGTRFATPLYVQDSGKPGPTVLIVGGVHGNEPAGAAAAEAIRHWPLRSGKLVVVPRANVPGLAANTRRMPGVDTNHADLNRNYPRAGQPEETRGEVAAAIWQVVRQHQPDWVLDLHEGFDFHKVNSRSVGSTVIAARDERSRAAGQLMVDAVNADIADADLEFTLVHQPIDGSLARAAVEHLKIPGFTLETTTKNQPLAKRVAQHETMVRALLAHLNMVDAAAPATPAVVPEAKIRIALYRGPGAGGAGPTNLLTRLNRPPETGIVPVSPAEVASGVLTNFDVVIFPGGSASRQAEAIGEEGREEVRKFVARGGGYIGICAGAYLATSGYPWSLKIINAKTISPQWRRGVGPVQMELSAAGASILGPRDGQFSVRYANGPIVEPAGVATLPPYTTLAWFRSELAENDTPVGIMIHSPAIFSGVFQNGRVVCVSPHPESTAGLEDMIPRAVNWVASNRSLSTKPTVKHSE
ncbi:MAG: succinylglutamate desuccinylase/aspartoacylase family protein [Limisphaerales bacterium]